MPISYETPAPIGAIVNANRAQSQGGGGVSLAEMYAAEMGAKQNAMLQNAQLQQRDRQFADQQLQHRDDMVAERTYSPRDAGLAQAAMAQANQRASLQAQLQQEEMSNAEYMRLQRLRQAEDAVKQAGTNGELLPQEVEQHLMQLRTGINPLQQKKAATEAKHMELQNQAIQNQMEIARQGELRKQKDAEDHLAYSAAAIQGKVEYVPDRQAAEELTREIASSFPDMPPEDIKKLAKKEAINQGRYTTWFPNEKGVPTHAKEIDLARMQQQTGAQPGAGKSSSANHAQAKGGSQFDPSKAYHDAEAAVDKLIESGAVKREDADAEIQKRFAARKAAVEGFHAGEEAKQNVGKPQPFNPHKAEDGTDKQKAVILSMRNEFSKLVTPDIQGQMSLAKQVEVNKLQNQLLDLAAKNMSADGKVKAPDYVDREAKKIEARLRELVMGKTTGPMTEDQRWEAIAKEGRKLAGPEPEPIAPQERPLTDEVKRNLGMMPRNSPRDFVHPY